MTHKLLDRITILLQIDLRQLLDEADDPRAVEAHYFLEMDQGLAQAKDAAAAAVAQEHRIAQRLCAAQAQAEKWDARTDAALQAGDEQGAKQALKRYQTHAALLAELRQQLEHQQRVTAEMKEAVRALEKRIQETRKQHADR